ncbi:MAG: hypothetical protein JWO09_2544 [Bacteroidetes bacterium]|nr:hypothetical protein [Bacteroidota bacterium]
MNKSFYILLFILASAFTKAQTNLVYNGDFEMYDTCPVIVSQPGDPQLETCFGWKSPTDATSDYYNVCATSIVGVPTNTFGYQYPYSGNAYCGIFIEYVAPPYSTYGYWFEYLQGGLITPLKAGYEYEFSCQVVMSDFGWDYALSKFGAAFTPNAISKTDGKPFSGVTPQVLNSATNYLTDTLHWMEIKGKLVAQGGEQYITLGFFSDTINLDTLKQLAPFFDPNHFGTYYFIDACTLTETGKVEGASNIFTPNGDGQNDLFSIAGLQNDEKVVVFDRWGMKVAEFSGENSGWDGRTTAGENCVDGVYYYILQREEEKESLKGFVQLVR